MNHLHLLLVLYTHSLKVSLSLCDDIQDSLINKKQKHSAVRVLVVVDGRTFATHTNNCITKNNYYR